MSRPKREGWALGLLALLAACAGARPRPDQVELPKPPTNALAWLPAESQVIARVHLPPWRDTPLWASWEEAQAKATAWPTWIDVELVDEVAIGGDLGTGALSGAKAGGDPGAQGSFVAGIKGRFGEGYLAKLAARDRTPLEKHGAYAFYVAQQVRWLQTAPGMIVVCSPDRAAHVAARATEGGEAVAIAEHPLVRSLGDRLQFTTADLALLADDTHGEGKSQFAKQGGQLGLAPLARDVIRAGLSVGLGNTVTLALAAETPDAASAAELKVAVDGTLLRFSRNLFVGLLGLGPLIESLRASHEGSHVAVRGALPEADVRALLSKAASLLEVAVKRGGLMRLAP